MLQKLNKNRKLKKLALGIGLFASVCSLESFAQSAAYILPALDRTIIADFDGDGRDDIMQTTGDSQSGLMISWGGTSPYVGWTSGEFTGYNPNYYGVGDFDADGKSDLFFMSGRDWYIFYSNERNESPSLLKVRSGLVDAITDISQLGFGNFDSPSKPATDIIWFSDNTSQGFGYWTSKGLRSTDGFNGRYTLQTGSYTGFPKTDYQIGDYDMDGMSDLFYANGSSWWVAYDGKYWSQIRTGVSKTLDNLLFGNFDNSDQLNTPDIVWTSQNTDSGLDYWINDTNNFNGRYNLKSGSYTGFSKNRYSVGDFIGNHQDEVIVSGSDNLWSWGKDTNWQILASMPLYNGVILSDEYVNTLVSDSKEVLSWAACPNETKTEYIDDCVAITSHTLGNDSDWSTDVFQAGQDTSVCNNIIYSAKYHSYSHQNIDTVYVNETQSTYFNDAGTCKSATVITGKSTLSPANNDSSGFYSYVAYDASGMQIVSLLMFPPVASSGKAILSEKSDSESTQNYCAVAGTMASVFTTTSMQAMGATLVNPAVQTAVVITLSAEGAVFSTPFVVAGMSVLGTALQSPYATTLVSDFVSKNVHELCTDLLQEELDVDLSENSNGEPAYTDTEMHTACYMIDTSTETMTCEDEGHTCTVILHESSETVCF